MMKGPSIALMGMMIVVLVGCDQSGPERAEAEVAAIEVEASMDESAECGAIAYLMKAFPGADTLEGMAESYRGCDSLISAQLHYGDDEGQVMYSLSVLSPDQEGMAADNGSWARLARANAEAVEQVIATRRQGNNTLSAEALLPDGASGVVYQDGDEWSLVARLNERHALRIDASKPGWRDYNAGQAQALMASLVTQMDLSGL